MDPGQPSKRFIRNSSSPHGAPCFFVKQKGQTSTLYGLPRKETSPRLLSSRSTDKFEFLVMPFGLANAPAQFNA
ncbi:hypothetical protein BASA83_013582 [Batrachochytrium salamandrivorans]|nr:hypothetical protein BASA83_013582 [Batrachochytrium salamandrivorans]